MEIFEFSEPDARMEKVDAADAGNLQSWLVSRRELESVLSAAGDAISRVRAIVADTADATRY